MFNVHDYKNKDNNNCRTVNILTVPLCSADVINIAQLCFCSQLIFPSYV